jgi:hypothetical protein
LLLQLQLHEAREALERARNGWSQESTALRAELSASLACQAKADSLVELLLQQQNQHLSSDAERTNTADEECATVPHIDRASRRLSSEHEDLRAASARVVTLQWELGRCNAERQG